MAPAAISVQMRSWTTSNAEVAYKAVDVQHNFPRLSWQVWYERHAPLAFAIIHEGRSALPTVYGPPPLFPTAQSLTLPAQCCQIAPQEARTSAIRLPQACFCLQAVVI